MKINLSVFSGLRKTLIPTVTCSRHTISDSLFAYSEIARSFSKKNSENTKRVECVSRTYTAKPVRLVSKQKTRRAPTNGVRTLRAIP